MAKRLVLVIGMALVAAARVCAWGHTASAAALSEAATALERTDSQAEKTASIADKTISISEKAKGMEKMAGYFNIYWDAKAGKLWLEIDKWGTEFLYQSSLTAGIGSN